ncbi:unnamed protein product [Vitrella brassicaformis CCMP3155]|uniref:MATH domain-containing protein n=5 Tax=Vitrella brassicaformis TaxID=1169539 RepID=A0A0G4G9G1_VITBC|nr:unnamed protein product [Vitrella brassicaformis CCMP3155]|eukprot:CEM25586.1 unnamed protein product [Vitrella brassicaformis CCMP3155]
MQRKGQLPPAAMALSGHANSSNSNASSGAHTHTEGQSGTAAPPPSGNGHDVKALALTMIQRAKRDRKYSLATAVLKTGEPPLQAAVFHELVNYVRDPRTASLRPEVTVEMTFALRCLQLDYERFRCTEGGENPLAQPVKAAIAAVWKDARGGGSGGGAGRGEIADVTLEELSDTALNQMARVLATLKDPSADMALASRVLREMIHRQMEPDPHAVRAIGQLCVASEDRSTTEMLARHIAYRQKFNTISLTAMNALPMAIAIELLVEEVKKLKKEIRSHSNSSGTNISAKTPAASPGPPKPPSPLTDDQQAASAVAAAAGGSRAQQPFSALRREAPFINPVLEQQRSSTIGSTRVRQRELSPGMSTRPGNKKHASNVQRPAPQRGSTDSLEPPTPFSPATRSFSRPTPPPTPPRTSVPGATALRQSHRSTVPAPDRHPSTDMHLVEQQMSHLQQRIGARGRGFTSSLSRSTAAGRVRGARGPVHALAGREGAQLMGVGSPQAARRRVMDEEEIDRRVREAVREADEEVETREQALKDANLSLSQAIEAREEAEQQKQAELRALKQQMEQERQQMREDAERQKKATEEAREQERRAAEEAREQERRESEEAREQERRAVLVERQQEKEGLIAQLESQKRIMLAELAEREEEQQMFQQEKQRLQHDNDRLKCELTQQIDDLKARLARHEEWERARKDRMREREMQTVVEDQQQPREPPKEMATTEAQTNSTGPLPIPGLTGSLPPDPFAQSYSSAYATSYSAGSYASYASPCAASSAAYAAAYGSAYALPYAAELGFDQVSQVQQWQPPAESPPRVPPLHSPSEPSAKAPAPAPPGLPPPPRKKPIVESAEAIAKREFYDTHEYEQSSDDDPDGPIYVGGWRLPPSISARSEYIQTSWDPNRHQWRIDRMARKKARRERRMMGKEDQRAVDERKMARALIAEGGQWEEGEGDGGEGDDSNDLGTRDDLPGGPAGAPQGQQQADDGGADGDGENRQADTQDHEQAHQESEQERPDADVEDATADADELDWRFTLAPEPYWPSFTFDFRSQSDRTHYRQLADTIGLIKAAACPDTDSEKSDVSGGQEEEGDEIEEGEIADDGEGEGGDEGAEGDGGGEDGRGDAGVGMVPSGGGVSIEMVRQNYPYWFDEYGMIALHVDGVSSGRGRIMLPRDLQGPATVHCWFTDLPPYLGELRSELFYWGEFGLQLSLERAVDESHLGVYLRFSENMGKLVAPSVHSCFVLELSVMANDAPGNVRVLKTCDMQGSDIKNGSGKGWGRLLTTDCVTTAMQEANSGVCLSATIYALGVPSLSQRFVTNPVRRSTPALAWMPQPDHPSHTPTSSSTGSSSAAAAASASPTDPTHSNGASSSGPAAAAAGGGAADGGGWGLGGSVVGGVRFQTIEEGDEENA